MTSARRRSSKHRQLRLVAHPRNSPSCTGRRRSSKTRETPLVVLLQSRTRFSHRQSPSAPQPHSFKPLCSNTHPAPHPLHACTNPYNDGVDTSICSGYFHCVCPVQMLPSSCSSGRPRLFSSIVYSFLSPNAHTSRYISVRWPIRAAQPSLPHMMIRSQTSP